VLKRNLKIRKGKKKKERLKNNRKRMVKILPF
jgi:hypothetical protein